MDRLNEAVARIVSVKLALGVANLQKEDSNLKFNPEEPDHSYNTD